MFVPLEEKWAGRTEDEEETAALSPCFVDPNWERRGPLGSRGHTLAPGRMDPVVLGQQLGKALGHQRAECPQQGRGAPGSEAEDSERNCSRARHVETWDSISGHLRSRGAGSTHSVRAHPHAAHVTLWSRPSVDTHSLWDYVAPSHPHFCLGNPMAGCDSSRGQDQTVTKRDRERDLAAQSLCGCDGANPDTCTKTEAVESPWQG